MASIPYSGETDVKRVIEEQLDLQCDIGLGAPKKHAFRSVVDAPEKEVEIDFLIPFGKYCIVGEHTSSEKRDEVKKRLDKLSNKLTFLETVPDTARFVPFTMSSSRRAAYKDVNTLIGCLIYNNGQHQREIETTGSKIIALSPRKWDLIEHYAKCLGRFGKYHFLDSVGVPLPIIADHSREGSYDWCGIEPGSYLHLPERILPIEDASPADIYIFTISPDKLLPISRVLRRDNLPSLTDPTRPNKNTRYQRVLIQGKLEELRRIISSFGISLSYPTAILALMSNKVEILSSSNQLMIPYEFGALDIIDGQHRLFAYASSDITDETRKNSSIVVIGIRFSKGNKSKPYNWAAQMFIDINTKQTRVRRDHQQIVAYELGRIDSTSLAAGLLLKMNEKGPLQDRLAIDSQSLPTSVKITTITTKAKRLFEFQKIRSWPSSAQKKWVRMLFETPVKEVEILAPGKETEYLDKVVILANKFFSRIKSTFPEDWNSPGVSPLISARYFAALFDVLADLMKEGKTWEQTGKWIDRVKKRSSALSGSGRGNNGYAFVSPPVPGIKDSVKQIANHLRKCGKSR